MKVLDVPTLSSRPGSYVAWDSAKKSICWFYEGGREPAYMAWDLAKQDYVVIIPPVPGQPWTTPQAEWNEAMNRYVVIPPPPP